MTTDLITLGKLPLAAFGLGLARCLGLLQIIPITTRLGLTGMHRAAVAATLSLVSVPVILQQVQGMDLTGGRMLLLTAKESFIGFLLGLIFAMPFWAAETAGELLDQQRGAKGATVPDPSTGAEAGLTATLFALTLATLFIAAGGMHWLMDAILQSYVVWPAGTLLPQLSPAAAPHLLGMLDGVLGAGLVLAAPLLIAMVLAEFGLALVSRFAPSLNVFDLSMSLKGLVMVIGLPIYLVFLIGYFRNGLAPLVDLRREFSVLSGQ